MGAFGILFCNNFKRVFFYFFIVVNGRKTHSCVEEKKERRLKSLQNKIPNAPIRVGLTNRMKKSFGTREKKM